MSKKSKHIDQKQAPTPKTMVVSKRPIATIAIKFFALCMLVALGIYISDEKGIFDPNNKNNHTIKKWDAFYEFTQEHNVDVLLVGNSHLYTGINPKNLSARLGANAFILASPGTHIGDTYFALVEALTATQPTHVIVETFGIDEFDPYSLVDGALSDQFKSFSARKNTWIKVTSMPHLFTSKNYGYAWSNTLRNHDYLLTKPKQIEKNTSSTSRFTKPRNEELYLGRFVRFTTGLNDSILNLYKEKGAPVKGEEYRWNDYTKHYVDRIVELCKEKNIQLIFLTLPMYKEHISNYQKWQEELARLLDKTEQPWLNLQTEKYHTLFGPESFESTYNSNQHMTYNGSLLATNKLADFIEEHAKKVQLTSRAEDKEWLELFYGEEGYFEHHSPKENDKKHQLLSKQKVLDNISIQEFSYVTNKTNKSLLVKVAKSAISDTIDITKCQIRLNLNFQMKGSKQNALILLPYDRFHTNPKFYVFKTNVLPITNLELLGGGMVCE